MYEASRVSNTPRSGQEQISTPKGRRRVSSALRKKMKEEGRVEEQSSSCHIPRHP